ncbi:MAG TPA: ThuA domain-containing protein, partial [Verrucomicrobiae bacterium]|nr:ThuA domain-containing protein [Verrucomicrobiae bacterium]
MKLRTLVLCDDPFHPAATVRRGLRQFARRGFDFEWVEDGKAITAKLLKQFPLVILAKANAMSRRDPRAWLTKRAQKIFQRHVRSGGGLVVIHSGTAGYRRLPEVRRAVGGAFLRHPQPCAVVLEPKPGFPLAEDVAPFTVRDEQYFVELDASVVEVFLISRSRHGVQPAGWTRTENGGRVCVLTPGHGAAVWRHPSFQKLLLNALR